jgi:hypothetical protein
MIGRLKQFRRVAARAGLLIGVSQTTPGLVSPDAFARSKDATPSPPRSSHFRPWWCTPRVRGLRTWVEQQTDLRTRKLLRT